MRDVLKIDVPKARIMAMPARERAMFLLLGYAANQVALYTKTQVYPPTTRRQMKLKTPYRRRRA